MDNYKRDPNKGKWKKTCNGLYTKILSSHVAVLKYQPDTPSKAGLSAFDDKLYILMIRKLTEEAYTNIATFVVSRSFSANKTECTYSVDFHKWQVESFDTVSPEILDMATRILSDLGYEGLKL